MAATPTSCATLSAPFVGVIILLASFSPGMLLIGFSLLPLGLSATQESMDKKRHFLVGVTTLSINFAVGVFIPAVFYVKSGHLRKTVWKAFRKFVAQKARMVNPFL